MLERFFKNEAQEKHLEKLCSFDLISRDLFESDKYFYLLFIQSDSEPS